MSSPLYPRCCQRNWRCRVNLTFHLFVSGANQVKCLQGYSRSIEIVRLFLYCHALLLPHFPFHFTSFSALLYVERSRNKLPCKPRNELATFALKLYRKNLQQIFNKLHKLKLRIKLYRKRPPQIFLMKKLHQTFSLKNTPNSIMK